MNEPIVYKDPNTGLILEVVEAQPVTLEDIDSRIAEHNAIIARAQEHINRLNTLRDKVASFANPAPEPVAAPADNPARAEQPAPAETLAEQAPVNPDGGNQAPPISA